MATPIFCCGAECGITTAGATGSPAAPHWNAAAGTIAIDTTVPRNGARCYKFSPAANTSYLSKAISGSPNTGAARFAIRFGSLPASNAIIAAFTTSGSWCLFGFRASDSTIGITTVSNFSNFKAGPVVSTGVWYVVDMKVDISANPWKVDCKVDGVATTQCTSSTAANTFVNFRIGGNADTSTTPTYDLYVDDIILSATGADYPFGRGKVLGLSPNADGTHSFNAAGDFKYNDSTNVPTNATDVYSYLDDALNNITDFIAAAGVAASEYFEVAFADTAETADARAVEVVSAQHAAGTSANKSSLRLVDGGSTSDVYADGDFSNTTITYHTKQYATPPSGGTWTPAKINALKARWGSSFGTVDISPVPYLDGLMLEVEYEQPLAQTKTVTAGGVVKKTGITATVSAAGVLQQVAGSVTVTVSATGVVRKTLTATVTASAVLGPKFVRKTVKPAGGGDYSSLSAAISGEVSARANLVSRDEVLEIACYAGQDTTAVTVNGFTTDATHYVRIFCPAGEGHAGKWDDTKYRLESTNANTLVISDNFVRVEQLQLKLTSSNASTLRACTVGTLSAGAYDIRHINILARGVGNGSVGMDGFVNSSTDDAAGKTYYINCMAYDFHDGSVFCAGFNMRSGSLSQAVYAYNCTSVRCQTGFQKRSYSRHKNCVAVDCWNGWGGDTNDHSDSDYNASTIAPTDAYGTHSRDKIAVLFTDPLNADYRILAGDSGVVGQGTDLSADAAYPFNYDIAGTTRSGTWTAGCYHQAGSAAQDVRWVWAGAVTTSGAKVKAQMNTAEESATVYLVVSTNSDLSSPTTFGPVTAASADNQIATLTATGLSANTQYYYGIKTGSTTYTRVRGKFKTFPSGAATFTFAVSGDSDMGAADPAYGNIVSAAPLFFQMIGDLHYQDISTNDVSKFRDAYANQRFSTPQLNFAASFPIDYVWDDHDWGGDSSNKNATAGPAAATAYREHVPAYTLNDSTGIWHSYVCGRVRFIVTDLRSQRSPNSDTDNSSKTMMGTTQKAWFKDELLAAKAAGQIVFWVCPTPWVAATTANADHWGGFNTERKEISDFIQSHGIAAVIRLSTDAHMVALDDGTNDLFTTDTVGNKLVTFHAAPLRQSGSIKGGSYSHGTYSGTNNESEGQWGLVTVTDTNGETIDVTLVGKKGTTQLLSYSKTLTVPATRTKTVSASAVLTT